MFVHFRLLEAALYADEYPIKTIDFDQVEFSGDSFKLLASEISSRNIQVRWRDNCKGLQHIVNNFTLTPDR